MAARRRRGRSPSKARREFVSEAEEILERMRADLADLLDQRAAGDDVDPDLINGLFRSAHSLKGLASLFGFDGVGELAHRVEDVLDGLRLGRIPVSSPAVDLIDEAVQLFASLLGEAGEPGTGATAPLADLVQRIEAAARPTDDPADEIEELDLDPSLLRALTEYEEHRLRENVRRGRRVLQVESTFEIISFEGNLAELSAAIREVGELLSTLPSPGDAPESQIRFSLLAATDLSADELAARLDLPPRAVRCLFEGRSATARPAPAPAEPRRGGAAESSVERTSSPAEPVAPGSRGEIESLKSISETVRVDICKLDELMNLVGELVIQRKAVAAIAARLESEAATALVGRELTKVHKDLDRKLKDLQTAVLDVRMVPLHQVFDKLARVVRRLRRDLGKEVRLDIRGANTELDKMIVEQLVDPLVHVVRNAFDHAIEPAAEREAAGKPVEGTIRIEALQRGNQVVIAIRDDGRGIDPQAIRAAAEARGLVAPGRVLGREETLDLIFEPGLSTRIEITETSGRGVGMDVVRSNLSSLGGVVSVESSVGRGTTITLTIPITLAIIQTLIVGVSDQRFAIPMNSVLETLLVEPLEIRRSEGREILNLRGDPLPLRRLARELGLADPDPEAKQYVLVLGIGELRIGLMGDRIEWQQDTVIKPIQGPVKELRGIAGAAETGDLGAVLVLDILALVDESARRRDAA